MLRGLCVHCSLVWKSQLREIKGTEQNPPEFSEKKNECINVENELIFLSDMLKNWSTIFNHSACSLRRCVVVVVFYFENSSSAASACVNRTACKIFQKQNDL